jgi:methyl-accepting chemotaxis protein
VVELHTQGSPEVALNQKVKQLIQKLGEAIHETVSESEDIAGVVKNIREQGFDVLLMLEATIGLNEVEDESEEVDEEVQEDTSGAFTRNDLTFLKSLRISLDDSDPAAESASEPASPDV